eukprot:jgi/Psemu1/283203/fgenesh1_pg.22_\
MSSETHPMTPVPEAIRRVMTETAKMLLDKKRGKPTVRIPLSSTPWSALLGCVLAEDVLMKEPGYPPYTASIMDGYAISTTEFATGDAQSASAAKSWTHRVVDKVYAGGADLPTTLKEEDGRDNLPTACYITTGAVVPEAYNCVVPIEECEVSSSTSRIRIAPSAALKENTWIRPIGCDIKASAVVLPKGHVMDPVAIGLAKQSGVEHITVKRRIKVGVLSTGNELIPESASGVEQSTWQTNATGKIPDVNRPVLLGLLSTSTFQNMCEPIDLGMVRDDDIKAMEETVEGALDRCDIMITTGGVSMGETDIVERVLVEKCGGTLHFGRMHMKPGKPTTFFSLPRKVDGEDRIKLVFAQPGNPCSAVVCTQLLVGPCLNLYFHGIDDEVESNGKTREEQLDDIVHSSFVHPEIEATLTHDVKLDAKRPEYHRVILTKSIGHAGETYEALSTGVQRSSRLMSMRDAQGLMLLPHVKGVKRVARKGEAYPVLLLNNNFDKDPVRIRDSIHLRERKGKPTKVCVIEVLPSGNPNSLLSNLEETCDRIQKSLTVPEGSSEVIVVSNKSFSGSIEELYSFAVKATSGDVDLIVVSCVRFSGSFQYHLDVSKTLRNRLSKVANSLALQARMGAASQDPAAALFETVVGYFPNNNGAMLICIEDNGLEGALKSTRSLISHGLKKARGV